MFEKIDMNVDRANVEDCHWVKTQISKKVIIRFSRSKDINEIRAKKR